MGIDPVTHSPRLDLLDLSSHLLTSPLYNQSQLNLSRLLGIQTLVNPDQLLRLATTLLSTQRDNPDLQLLQNLQENNSLCNSQFHNHFPSFITSSNQPQTPIQDITGCTTSTTPSSPLMNETQLLQANVDQFPSNSNSFSCHNSPASAWQEDNGGALPSNFTDNFIPLSNYGYYTTDNQSIVVPLSENSYLQSNNNNNHNQNFNFPSVLSTPSSSSPTPLNSSPTYINGSTEDERDSYCSNMLKYELPDLLDVNDFM